VTAEMLAKLHQCLSKDSIRHRKNLAFHPIAQQVLQLADSSSSWLSKFPHMLVLKILKYAAPEGFALHESLPQTHLEEAEISRES